MTGGSRVITSNVECKLSGFPGLYWQLLATCFVHFEEIYLFANEGENHTNNVKQLEEMKKGTEDTDRTFGSLNLLVIRTSSLAAANLKLRPDLQALKISNPLGMHHIGGADRNGAF